MRRLKRILGVFVMLVAPFLLLTSCDGSNTSVYGTIGVSSGYSSYNGGYHGGYNSGPRMRGSITIGGRIR